MTHARGSSSSVGSSKGRSAPARYSTTTFLAYLQTEAAKEALSDHLPRNKPWKAKHLNECFSAMGKSLDYNGLNELISCYSSAIKNGEEEAWMEFALNKAVHDLFTVKGDVQPAIVDLLKQYSTFDETTDKIKLLDAYFSLVKKMAEKNLEDGEAEFLSGELGKLLNDIKEVDEAFCIKAYENSLKHYLNPHFKTHRLFRTTYEHNIFYKHPEQIATANSILQQRKAENFFELGQGGLKQFKLDVLNREEMYRIFGKSFSDEDVNESLEATKELSDDEIKEKLIEMCQEEVGEESEALAEAIIAAHAQGPHAFIPYAVAGGVESAPLAEEGSNSALEHEDEKIYICQPTERQANLFRVNDAILLRIRFESFPIQLGGDRKEIAEWWMPGPIEALYKLNSEKKGYQLICIRTNSPHLERIMRGELISEEEIKSHFCPSLKIKPAELLTEDLPEEKQFNWKLVGFVAACVIACMLFIAATVTFTALTYGGALPLFAAFGFAAAAGIAGLVGLNLSVGATASAVLGVGIIALASSLVTGVVTGFIGIKVFRKATASTPNETETQSNESGKPGPVSSCFSSSSPSVAPTTSRAVAKQSACQPKEYSPSPSDHSEEEAEIGPQQGKKV